MKKVLQILLLLAISLNVAAQTTYNRIYDSSPASATNHDYVYDAIPTADGGMAFLGSIYDTPSSTHLAMYLTKTDANGVIQWTYESEPTLGGWPSTLTPHSVCQGSDGFFYIAGTYQYNGAQHDLMIKKISNTGTHVYTKFWGEAIIPSTFWVNVRYPRIMESPTAGTFYVSYYGHDGISGGGGGAVFRVNPNAGTITMNAPSYGTHAKVLPDGRIGVLSVTKMTILNSSGSVYAQFNVPANSNDFICGMGSGYVFIIASGNTVNGFLTRIDYSGGSPTVGWHKSYKFTTGSTADNMTNVTFSSDYNILASGRFVIAGQMRPAYMKVNIATGNVMWSNASTAYVPVAGVRMITLTSGKLAGWFSSATNHIVPTDGDNIIMNQLTPTGSMNSCSEYTTAPIVTTSTFTSSTSTFTVSVDPSVPQNTYAEVPTDQLIIVNSSLVCSGSPTVIAPVADFIGLPSTSISTGGSVNFSDLSTNSPTSWSWVFTGGSPGTSTLQNPVGITYSTPGCYQVQLTATNSAGSDVETKVCYINVSAPGTPPVANFIGTPTTVATGGTVNFTDLSTNSPTSWSWVFTGGSPGTSTLQNPTNITYSTPGCYQVSLTATNSFGSDAEVKVCYINVTSGGGGGTCDTLKNFDYTDTPMIYVDGTGGYVAGHNSYLDVAKADKFSTYTAGYLLQGAYIQFSRAKYASGASTFTMKVWDDNGAAGAPNTVLATKTVNISSLAPDVAAGTISYIPLTTPLSVTGPFYLGIEFAYASGDTVAMVTNADGETVPGTAWEKWSDGVWHAYSDAGGWAMNVAHIIRPLLCSPSTGLDEDGSEFSLNIYPNPANAAVNISLANYNLAELENGYSLYVYDVMGKLVLTKQLTNENTEVNIDELKSGMYVFQLQTSSGRITKRIVKQ